MRLRWPNNCRPTACVSASLGSIGALAFGVVTARSALVFSFPFGCAVGIPITPAWGYPVAIFAVILLVVMGWAWRDTMDMLEFMASFQIDA